MLERAKHKEHFCMYSLASVHSQNFYFKLPSEVSLNGYGNSFYTALTVRTKKDICSLLLQFKGELISG